MQTLKDRTEKPSNSSVYLDFYKLQEHPFSITPDPEFLFLSQTHQCVMEKVMYGINIRGGFILLSGEVGTGKTTICRSIIDKLNNMAEIVYLINPSISGKDLISNILDDLGIQYPRDATKKELINQLNKYLLGRNSNDVVVIIIDDAQTMHLEALEDLRLLSNLETDKEKMLQIVLVGQPELIEMLARPETRQLKQRIIVNCNLEHLTPREVDGYIDRRLFIAGSKGQIQFSQRAIRLIAKRTKGIPRLINKICDYALIAGYSSNAFTIQKKHVQRAFDEIGSLDFKRRGFSSLIFNHPPTMRQRFFWASSLISAIVVVFLLIPMSLEPNFLQIKDSLSRIIQKKSSISVNLKPDTDALKVNLSESVNATRSNREHSSSVLLRKTENPTGKPAKNLGQKATSNSWIPTYQPFVIQLATLRSIERVKRAVSSYNNKGLEVHWNPIDIADKGRWYRIFSGNFESKTEAVKVRQDRRLIDSIIRFNPWTIIIGPYSDVNILAKDRSLLDENHYDSYIVDSDDNTNWLLSGAFATRQEAERMVNELNKFGLSARVAPR
jgi:general secretion pathway protein A